MNYKFPYKLAKKLNDAGFPQNHEWIEGKYTIHCNKCASNVTLSDYESCRPTLSELIEACGENIKNIDFIHDSNLVIAYAVESFNKKGEGISPEEAVANLWLELNKK